MAKKLKLKFDGTPEELAEAFHELRRAKWLADPKRSREAPVAKAWGDLPAEVKSVLLATFTEALLP